MKFFKKYLMPCLAVALTVCLAACGDDAPAGEGEGGGATGDEVLTPAENKAKFESIASDVLAQFTPSDHEAVLTALNDFTDFADNGGLEIERNAYSSVMGMMNSMADVCGDNNLGRMMDFTRAGSDLYRAAQYYGIYTYNNGVWTKEESDSKLEFRFTTYDGRAVVATATTSGSEVTFWRTTDDGEELAVPEYAEATITVDGQVVCAVNVDAQLDASAKSAVVKANLDASGYVFNCTVNATSSKATADLALKKNGTNIILAIAEVNGQRMTDPSQSDEDNPQNLFNGASSRVSIMDDAYITASCANIKELVDGINDIEDKYDYMQEELCCKEQAEFANSKIDIKLYYTNSTAVQATLGVQAYYEGETGTYYDPATGQYLPYEYWNTEPIITFADGSKYSLDEYFDDNVTFGDLIDSYEELERQYSDYLSYF